MKKFLNSFKTRSKDKKSKSKDDTKSKSSPDLRDKHKQVPNVENESQVDAESTPRNRLGSFASPSSTRGAAAAPNQLETSKLPENELSEHSEAASLMEPVRPLLVGSSDEGDKWSDESEDAKSESQSESIVQENLPINPENEIFTPFHPDENSRSSQEHDDGHGSLKSLESEQIQGSDEENIDTVNPIGAAIEKFYDLSQGDSQADIDEPKSQGSDSVWSQSSSDAGHRKAEEKHDSESEPEPEIEQNETCAGNEHGDTMDQTPVSPRSVAEVSSKKSDELGIPIPEEAGEANEDGITNQLLEMFNTGNNPVLPAFEERAIPKRSPTPFFESPRKRLYDTDSAILENTESSGKLTGLSISKPIDLAVESDDEGEDILDAVIQAGEVDDYLVVVDSKNDSPDLPLENERNIQFTANFETETTAPASLEPEQLFDYQDILQRVTRALILEKVAPRSNLPTTEYHPAEILQEEIPIESAPKLTNAPPAPVPEISPSESTEISYDHAGYIGPAASFQSVLSDIPEGGDGQVNVGFLNKPDQILINNTWHEDSDLHIRDSGADLVRLRSSEIFGNVESEPRLSVDNELTTLFQARGVSRNRSASLGGLSFQRSSSSSAIFSDPMKFSSTTSTITPAPLFSLTTFQPSSVSNDIPLSTLLQVDNKGSGDGQDEKALALELAAEAVASNGAFTRRYSSPNISIPSRQFSPMPQISEIQSVKTSIETLQDGLAAPEPEEIDEVLDLTMKVMQETLDQLVHATKSYEEIEPQHDNSDLDRTPANEAAKIEDFEAKLTTSGQETEESTTDDFYIRRDKQSRSRSRSCCGEENAVAIPRQPCRQPSRTPKKPAYHSGSVSRYCDALMAGKVEGNPEMVGDIIKDLQCVFEKTFGNSKNMEAKYECLLAQLAQLKAQLCQVVACRAKLEKEICRLQRELRTAQFAHDDQARGRMCLERVVAQLRSRLGKLETLAEMDAKEKMQLATCLKEMEARIIQLTEMIECLEHERDELRRNCRGFEDWRKKQTDASSNSKGRIAQLEEALAKCCKSNERLEEEIRRLREERSCLQAMIEKMKCEIKRVMDEFTRERDCWLKDRQRLEQMICDLKKALDCLTEQNQQICRKMTEVVAAHHVEMDCLKKEADKYKGLYECEKSKREKLEKALRDCEEKKKEMVQQFQQQYQALMQQQQQQQQQQQKPCSPKLSPCSDILNKLNSERGEYTQDLKSRLATANVKIECLEKDLQYTQTRNHEKETLLEKNKQETEQLKSTQTSLQMQLEKTRDELTQTRAMCEALRATNVQLQTELQLSRKDKSKSQEVEHEQVVRLREENQRLVQTIEEERATKELFRREVQDARRLWETEVKAKGVLADRITRTERMRIQNESNNNNDNDDEGSSSAVTTKLHETIRLLKTELKMERDQVIKLKTKIEQQRSQLRAARETLLEASNDSKARKLTIELDQQKHEYHNFVTSAQRDRETWKAEISRLEQAKVNLERELHNVRGELRENELNRDAIQEVMRRRDLLETEIQRLKTVVNEHYVERTKVDEWKAAYEARLASERNQCEASVQAQVKAKLLEMQLALDRQVRDRALIDKMRDSNVEAIRQEQTNLAANLKTEIEKLKQAVRAKEEEISSLQSSKQHLKKKFSSEANMKDELLKKLQTLSAASRISLPTVSDNNNL